MTQQSTTSDQYPLSGVRVLDLADERAIYGAKLLADLGATVVRIESSTGDALRGRGPFDNSGESLWFNYYASNRHIITLDPTDEKAKTELKHILRGTDVVIDTGSLESRGMSLEDLERLNPQITYVDVASFSKTGPWRNYLAPDLVAGALGGAAATTGDTDTTPLKLFGDQSFLVSGVYAAIAGLAGLFQSSRTGLAEQIDISVHETIVSTLEHVLMIAWYPEFVSYAKGNVLPRRGSLHWSNAYQVMTAKNGSLMVTPTPDVQKQIAWLAEEDLHEDLLDEKYNDLSLRQVFIKRLMDIMGKWVSDKDAETFFHEAQARHHPFGLVMKPDELAGNVHLESRSWWEDYTVENGVIKGPGSPYRFSRSSWKPPLENTVPHHDSEAIMQDIGWTK